MTFVDNEQSPVSSRLQPRVDHAASKANQSSRAVTPSLDSFTHSTTEREKEMPGGDLVKSNAYATEDPSHVHSATETGATLPRVSATEEEQSWDPLQSRSKLDSLEGGTALKGGLLGDIEEENINASTNTRLEHRVEATSDGSKRASHHRLDLRLSSPPPWELIDPPSDDGRKEFYTGYGSRKSNPLDNAM